jgi:DinB superfamily
MNEARQLCVSLLAKINEQTDGAGHLTRLLPPDCLDWAPAIPGAWPVGVLLGHLLDCMAGFCAVLSAYEPQRLAHFVGLRELPVNHRCTAGEAVHRIVIYRAHIGEGFMLLRDADLGRQVPTIFVKQGESLLTLLLGNLEHLINHKHQLFTYLKLLSVGVTSQDLYRFRG